MGALSLRGASGSRAIDLGPKLQGDHSRARVTGKADATLRGGAEALGEGTLGQPSASILPLSHTRLNNLVVFPPPTHPPVAEAGIGASASVPSNTPVVAVAGTHPHSSLEPESSDAGQIPLPRRLGSQTEAQRGLWEVRFVVVVPVALLVTVKLWDPGSLTLGQGISKS